MNISPVSSISAMKAATQRLGVTAHNVANVNTRGFRAYRAEQTEVVEGPDQTGAGNIRERGAGTRAYNAGRERHSRQDLNKEMTDMMTERNTYKANAPAARVRNEMKKEAIDLLG